MTDLTLRSIKKSYGAGATVLHPFDLHVNSGELIVLVGPSGCGKSTLLKLIAGLEPLDAGQVVLGERDITTLEPRDRRIAMVFQNYALYPHLSVRDNLAYPLQRVRTPKAQIATQVEAVAAQLRLSELLDRRPSQLSGGQKQRVAMGRAIIRQPDLFLLDEPLSNLDAGLRSHVRSEIRDLQRRLGTTMIYVTHDQVEAQTMADRLVIMRGGTIQQIGAPRDIYAHPANMFAASFLGSAPPNYIGATLDHANQTLAIAGRTMSFDALPYDVRLSLAGHQSVIVGIRPEHMRPLADNTITPDAIVITGDVHLREHVGHVEIMHFIPDAGTDISSQVANLTGRQTSRDMIWMSDAPHPLTKVTLSAAPDLLMFFDNQGRSLNAPVDII